ncbi:MAG: TspO/MBR family protein [Propionibacteriaceae bacterium]|nr:TspO/MBR family protein [Propionibacteriaceae bacterium]
MNDDTMRTAALVGTLTTACAVSGGVATNPKSAWYKALDKPAWQPPGAIFPVVWTGLYADIAVTTTLAIDELEGSGRNAEAQALRRALVVNLVLNQAWSWSFFKGRALGPATVVAALLAGSSIDLVRRVGRAGRGKGFALAPYAAWCSFATALTGEIWRRNRR